MVVYFSTFGFLNFCYAYFEAMSLRTYKFIFSWWTDTLTLWNVIFTFNKAFHHKVVSITTSGFFWLLVASIHFSILFIHFQPHCIFILKMYFLKSAYSWSFTLSLKIFAFLIGVFILFIFDRVTERFGFKPTIFLFVFYLSNTFYVPFSLFSFLFKIKFKLKFFLLFYFFRLLTC